MKRSFVPVEAIKIDIDSNSNILTYPATGCVAYVLNELHNMQCTTQDQGKVGNWISARDVNLVYDC